MNKQTVKTYAFWIGLSEAVGGLSGWLTREGSRYFSNYVTKPPLTPPAIVFPIVWGILFALMGISAARISLTPPSAARNRGLNLFVVQLAVNFLWSPVFFNLRSYPLALAVLVFLWILVLLMILSFRKADKTSAYLQLPYLVWLTFAGYLNIGVLLLN